MPSAGLGHRRRGAGLAVQAALFASIQQRYGVRRATHRHLGGDGFGASAASDMLSSIATLAYDAEAGIFTDQLYAALK